MVKKISKKIEKVARAYISEIENDIKIDKVIIFGSQAKGGVSNTSDIDIAMVSDFFDGDKYGPSYLFQKLWNVENSNIDPVGYSWKDFTAKTPSPLLSEIRRYGLELK